MKKMRKEIKVGDKVIVKKPQLNVANNTIIDVGEICTVEEIIKTSESSAVLKIKTSTGVWGYVNKNMVVKENDMFKEGDAAVAIATAVSAPDIVKGDLLVVRRTQRLSDKYILVSKKDDMNFMFIFPKEKLERIPLPKKEPLTGAMFYGVVKDMTKEDEKMLKELEEKGKLEYSFKCELTDPRGGMKNDFLDDKPRWDLLPLPEIEDLVKVYTAGAKKYAPNNWQKLDNGYQRYKAALFRHLLAYEKGEKIDPDTKCMHLAQVVWNAVAMLWFDKNGKGLC